MSKERSQSEVENLQTDGTGMRPNRGKAFGRVGIVGGGAWGTALAVIMARTGARITLWAREEEVVKAINTSHENTCFLPGVKLSALIRATNDFAGMAGCPIVFMAPPAKAMRMVASALAPHLSSGAFCVICTKGIEQGTARFMSEILAKTLPRAEPMVLSGPSFAADAARGLPVAVTLAAHSLDMAHRVAQSLCGPRFRPYLSDDLLGAQIGGAVKNVLAIACGIVEGRELGASARAALVTRAFAELLRFGAALGARPETLTGLCGLGDLILTCSSPLSRNMSLGIAIGRGRSVGDVLSERHTVSEGVYTAGAVMQIARGRGVEMPICEAVHRIITQECNIDMVIEELLNRPLRGETGESGLSNAQA